MSDIEIRTLKKDEYKMWDELVESSPHGTIFHKLDWLKIVERHTNSRLHLFVGYKGDEVVAAIPFFYHRKYCFKILSSPINNAMIQNLGPFIPNYGELKQDKREYYFREFQKKLDKYIYTRINPQGIAITTSPNLIDVRPYIWLKYQIIPRYNYIKNIEDLDLIWKLFKSTLRKNIHNAEKKGVEIIEDNIDGYGSIIQFLSKRLEEQEQRLPTSKEYMLDIYNAFYPNNLRVFISRYKGKKVGGIIFTTYRDKVSIWIGATRADLKGIYPVDLLQWKIIEWANKNGFKYCEILGANVPSISYFKSRYNFDLDTYYSVEKLSPEFKIVANAFRILRHLTSRYDTKKCLINGNKIDG
jgi:hypothetical protein